MSVEEHSLRDWDACGSGRTRVGVYGARVERGDARRTQGRGLVRSRAQLEPGFGTKTIRAVLWWEVAAAWYRMELQYHV